MTLMRLILRSIVHYRRTAAMVVLGLAIATAVIVGSLVIGDSIEGSIRHTSLARLGAISWATQSARPVPADAFSRQNTDDFGPPRAGLLILDGSARPSGSETGISGVSVIGADSDFARFYSGSAVSLPSGRSAIINQSLADAGGLSTGDTLLVTVSRPGRALPDTLFARRERQETLATLRVTVEAIRPDLGPAGLRLDPSTSMPRNVILDRALLSEQIDRSDAVNTVVFDDPKLPDQLQPRSDEALSEAHRRIALTVSAGLTLDVAGLYMRPHGQWTSAFSEAVTLSARQMQVIAEAAPQGAEVYSDSVYLTDTIAAVDDPSRSIAYAVAANVPAYDLPLQDGAENIEKLAEDQIILNAWAAEDLDAEVGERLSLAWRVSTPAGYEERSAELTLAGIAKMQGLAADPTLVPDFEGITDAENIDDWDPPFPVDLSRVTKRDDEYWERYRAAPRAFVHTSLLQRMWRGEQDDGPWVTSVRVGRWRGGATADQAEEFAEAIRAKLTPEAAGFTIRPVREQALRASKGTSDFGQLFLGMSFFLVIAGAGLAGTLMRLSAERRAAQAGIMMATGFTAKQSGRVIAAEGAALSVVGVALGTPLGIGYAHTIIRVLATRWQGALGDAPVLGVYAEPQSIAIGALSALIVGILATWWGARVLSGRPVLELLRGWQASATAPSAGRPWTIIATPVLLVAAIGLFIAAMVEAIPAEGAFFGIGGALLLAALTGAHVALTRVMTRSGATRSRLALALRSAASARGRSLLLLGLIAAATFVLVTVAANSRDFSAIDVHDRSSGTGGFALIATTSVPLRFDPATREGRENLGFLPEEQDALEGTTIISLPRSPGEDISCLNVARPALPRLVGVSDRLIERGGFTFADTIRTDARNPWTLLREVQSGAAVPALADSASLKWQLHSGVGERYDAGGDRPPLQFVGALSGSIFQSEILVHEDALQAMYPEIEGPSYFLIDAPKGSEDQVANTLRAALGDMGLEVRTTREVLNRFITVQNTYLSMFLALGGLGLLLGTIGLVAVILRSAFERRAEFALMLATGFTEANLTRLVLVENAGLLMTGMLVGTITALISVAPHLASAQAAVNWAALLVVLGAVLAVGLVACATGARATVRGDLIEALRTE